MNLFIHWLKTLFRWVSVMLMIPLLALVILLTPTGFKLSFALLSPLIPGELHYQQVTGTFLGPLTIKELDYRYQDRQISLNHLYLQWHPSELLAGKIFIETLRIDNLTITTPHAPSPAPAQEFSIAKLKEILQDIHPRLTAWHIPMKLQIEHSSFGNITWQEQPGAPTLQAIGVQIQGVVQPDTLHINIQAQLQNPYSIQTNLTVDGTPQQYGFELKAFNPKMHWLIKGQVNPHQIQLDSDKAIILGGELNVHLIWQWQAPMSWQLNLSGRHLDFSQLQPDWPHPLDITLNTSGSLSGNQPHFSWDADLSTPQTHIVTKGKHGQQWDFNWNIQIHQLAELLPFSSGVINSTGELHGSLTRPQTKGQLQASLLRWQDYRIDKINAQWDLDVSETRASFFQLAAEQIFTRWAEVQKIQLSGKGKWEKHELDATIHGYNTDLSVQLNGGLSGDHWQGSLQKFTVAAPNVGAWSLSQPTGLILSPQQADITALCLQSAYKAQLCFRGKWNGADDSWQIALTSRLNFQQIATLTPEALTVNLPMDLHLNAEGIGKSIQAAQLTGSTPGGDIRYTGPSVVTTQINSTQISGKLDKDGISLNLDIKLTGNNSISANLNLPRATSTSLFSKAQALQGKIKIELNDLSPLQTFIPEVVSPHGKFQANLTLGGTRGEPLVSGDAHIEGGELKIPGLNIQLNKINLALTAKGSQLNYTLTATSANQPLRIVGSTQLNDANFPTSLTLTGDNVLLADTPLYTVYVTPQVHITLKGRNIDISGKVNIPKAVLHQLEFQHETTLPEGEVVYIGERPLVKTTPWNISMLLDVSLGNDVKVDSPGLKGKLSGSLTIISQPGQVMLGVGRVDITDGIYSVYGRELNIAPGSGIIYRRNPLNNPALSIQATTRVIITDVVSQQQLGTNEITVGMSIGGTSSSPQVTLFSSAGNLSQADMLSFLLLGTSSSGISPTNMNLLLQALNTLPLTKKGAGSVEGLTNQVKQGLGLTELGVESEATFGPTGEAIPTSTPTSYFVVGKRLTSRIYLRYKYDPFNSVNLFQLNYLFSTNWSLQLETDGSTQSGADILYTIQTGTPTSADKTPAK